MFFLAFFLVVAAPSVSAQNQGQRNDPSQIGARDINKHSLNFYSAAREAALGEELAGEAEATARILDDPEVQNYVAEVAGQIGLNSDLHMPLRVRVIDSDSIAAFGLPGGHFFVTTGLLLETRSEAELAGVIAHQTGHMAARHATKQMTRAELWNLMTLPLGFFSGPVVATLRQGMMMAGPLTLFKFNRDFEREADRLGLQYEYASGYDPVAMLDFLERMKAKDKGKDHGGINRIFSSHPMTKDRMVEAERTIEETLPSRAQYVVSTSRFEEMQQHLRSLEADRIRAEKIYGPDPLGRKNPSAVGTLFGWEN